MKIGQHHFIENYVLWVYFRISYKHNDNGNNNWIIGMHILTWYQHLIDNLKTVHRQMCLWHAFKWINWVYHYYCQLYEMFLIFSCRIVKTIVYFIHILNTKLSQAFLFETEWWERHTEDSFSCYFIEYSKNILQKLVLLSNYY